jgi:tRNA (cmo5U34)-methyltransferase
MASDAIELACEHTEWRSPVSNQKVGEFFDSLTGEYTETIERCFPRYPEMLWAVLNYLPADRRFEKILELGCGTGNLSVVLHEAFPEAELRVVDISGESLDICRKRLSGCSQLTCDEADFNDLDFEPGSFDLVISNIAIHHLDAAGKQSLFRGAHGWLTDDGMLCFADQCAGETEDLYDRHIANWRQLTMEAGSTDAEWDMWMQHQAEHDHHDTLSDQMAWLREAGFPTVDCVWRFLLWSVIQARKAA